MSQNNSKTVITQIIDGIEVIKGFGKLSIDPHKTKEVVEGYVTKTDSGSVYIPGAIQATPEFLIVKEKQDARNEAAQKAGAENIKMKNAAKGSTAHSSAWRACEAHRNIAASFEAETRDALPALKKKKQELMSEQAIYFEPKLGEYAKTDAEIQALSDVLASVYGSGYVDLDGNILEDNRGAVCCVKSGGKWTVLKITTIGVTIPSSNILYSNLDADQKKEVDLQLEINAAASMSAGEKLQAKEAAEAKALNDAESLKGRLEIQSVPDALEQSQAWYNSRIAEIGLIYG